MSSDLRFDKKKDAFASAVLGKMKALDITIQSPSKEPPAKKGMWSSSPSPSSTTSNSFSGDELYAMMAVLFDQISSLKSLFDQIASLKSLYETSAKELEDLKKKLDSVSFSTTPPSPVPPLEYRKIALEAVRAEESTRMRKFQAFLKGLSTEQDSLNALTNLIGAPTPSKFHRLLSKSTNSPAPVIVTFHAQEDVTMFLRRLSQAKREKKVGPEVTARPNYSPDDLEKYRKSWMEVCKRNDEAKKMVCTVRGTTIVDLTTHREWKVKERRNDIVMV